jgi:hypothetical protein
MIRMHLDVDDATTLDDRPDRAPLQATEQTGLLQLLVLFPGLPAQFGIGARGLGARGAGQCQGDGECE